MTCESTNAPGMQTIPGNDWKHAVLSPQPQIRNCCEQLNFQTYNQMYSTSSQSLQRDKVKLNYLPAQNKIRPSNEWITISSANFRETYSYTVVGVNNIKPFPGNRKCQETLLCGLNSMSTLPLPEPWILFEPLLWQMMIHMIVNGVVYNSQDNQFLSKVEASLGCNRAFWAFWTGWLGCHSLLFLSTPDKDPGFDGTQPQALLLCSVLFSVLPQCFDRVFLQLDPLPISKWSRYWLVWNNNLLKVLRMQKNLDRRQSTVHGHLFKVLNNYTT